MTTYTINYRSCDGFRETRTFKTLAGATRYCHRMVGERPERGTSYAICDMGIGRVSGDIDAIYPRHAY